MKIFKILKLVAYTRSVGDRKRICLTDCFLIPYLVAKSKNEFNISEQINLDLLENLTRIYGKPKRNVKSNSTLPPPPPIPC